MNRTQALQDLDKKLERTKQDQVTERDLLNSLPDALNFRFLSTHAYKAAGSIHIEVSDLTAIPALLEKLPAIPLTLVKQGTLSLQPSETVSDELKEKCERYVDVMPWTFEADKLKNYPVKASVRWYTKLSNGLRLKVTAELEKHSVVYTASHSGKTEKSLVTGWHVSGLPHGELIRWYAGYDEQGNAEANNVTGYWYVGQVNTIQEALGL